MSALFPSPLVFSSPFFFLPHCAGGEAQDSSRRELNIQGGQFPRRQFDKAHASPVLTAREEDPIATGGQPAQGVCACGIGTGVDVGHWRRIGGPSRNADPLKKGSSRLIADHAAYGCRLLGHGEDLALNRQNVQPAVGTYLEVGNPREISPEAGAEDDLLQVVARVSYQVVRQRCSRKVETVTSRGGLKVVECTGIDIADEDVVGVLRAQLRGV